ncbi:cobalt-precorrin-6A reductase [Pararhodobacter sp.]|uniref:cobalt-precorrin-6A reductase n=1 Tax=Pararhodobacter sp. TaxID=2127056 RepID=UPI002FDF1B00
MPNILLLGGTMEASAMARRLADRGLAATLSYMGRVERPKPQPIAVRIGGFGGVPGLIQYLTDHQITHVIDATHPFAAQMSSNAVAACAATGTPLIALTRPAWQPGPGDDWQRVPDMDSAVAALAGPARRIMLAIGRMHLAEFAAQPQHHYLLRLVDAPSEIPPLPHHSVVVDRGPFSAEADEALMREHRIDLIVAKNAGGIGSVSKLQAARALHLPVLMIDRPQLPPRHETHDPEEVLRFVTA